MHLPVESIRILHHWVGSSTSGTNIICQVGSSPGLKTWALKHPATYGSFKSFNPLCSKFPHPDTESTPTADEFLPHNRIPVHRPFPKGPTARTSVKNKKNPYAKKSGFHRKDGKVTSYYTWEGSHIHLSARTFESMFFLYLKDRICQLGYSSRVLDTWNTHILTSHGTQKLRSWFFSVIIWCTGYSPVFWRRLPSWWITTCHV